MENDVTVMTPEAAKAEIGDLKQDKGFAAKFAAGDKEAGSRIETLSKIASGVPVEGVPQSPADAQKELSALRADPDVAAKLASGDLDTKRRIEELSKIATTQPNPDHPSLAENLLTADDFDFSIPLGHYTASTEISLSPDEAAVVHDDLKALAVDLRLTKDSARYLVEEMLTAAKRFDAMPETDRETFTRQQAIVLERSLRSYSEEQLKRIDAVLSKSAALTAMAGSFPADLTLRLIQSAENLEAGQ